MHGSGYGWLSELCDFENKVRSENDHQSGCEMRLKLDGFGARHRVVMVSSGIVAIKR